MIVMLCINLKNYIYTTFYPLVYFLWQTLMLKFATDTCFITSLTKSSHLQQFKIMCEYDEELTTFVQY